MKIYNFNDCRIGDKVASIYQLLHTYDRDEVILIDPTYTFSESFPVKIFLNDYFNYIVEVNNIGIGKDLEDELGLDKIDFHNLWISSPSLKKSTEYKAVINLPYFITQLGDTFRISPEKKVKDFKCVILHHPLIDAPYNKGRNVDLEQWRELIMDLHLDIKSEDITFVEIPIDRSLSVVQVISLLNLGHIYFGCDTGFSHLYSLIYPDRPMVVVYPDSSHDIRDYHHIKEKYGYSSEWCSDPINSFNYSKFILKDNRFDYDSVFMKLKEHVLEILNESK